ncbi:hypothetical protein [Nocardioides dongkuii]|uniref:hypothetical protein n=1 Tax=Nocardioides dongkuii TaxID=2760089 RepID=UPI0015FBC25F|nr:hypothetical protein [Nocardioides dongkuii]
MRRALGTVLLLAVLAACGTEGNPPAATDTPGASASPASPDTPAWSEVALVSESAGRGEVAAVATPLPDEAAVRGFVAPFDDRLANEVAVAARAAAVPEGQELYGAVVAIGCEVPSGVTVVQEGEDVVVTAMKEKPSPGVQCLVPVTTVALVLVEAGAA